MDVVHIPWEKVQYGQKNRYLNGKQVYPTVAFLVTCSRTREILSADRGWPGTENDLTISANDTFVREVHHGDEFREAEFQLYSGERDAITGEQSRRTVSD